MFPLRLTVSKLCSKAYSINYIYRQRRTLVLGQTIDRYCGCTKISKSYLSKNFCSTTTESNAELSKLISSASPLSTVANSTTENVDEAEGTAPSSEFLSTLSPEEQRTIQVLRMEIEVHRHSGLAVPKKISDDTWKDILLKKSRIGRLKFYRFLCIREFRKEKDIKKKEQSSLELMEVRKKREEEQLGKEKDWMEYGLSRNTLFLRISKASMNEVYNSWQSQAIMFGEKIVLDLGYHDHMVKRESLNCVDQIKELYGYNKQDRQPFNLHFCNLAKDTEFHEQLLTAIPNLYEANCLLTITEKCYMDLFPKEKLVYLTPHCNEDLNEYDYDAIYIIGGIVDKVNQKPLSLAKAKKQGIRMARLPLDNYLDWGNGSKTLALDHMLKIMLDLKNTKDWKEALKHIPVRKLNRPELGPRPFNRKLRQRSLYGRSGFYSPAQILKTN